jgi:hypothetical protein
MVPDCGSAYELQPAAFAAVPCRHHDGGPHRGRVGKDVGELRQLAPLFGWPAASAAALGQRREQIGIEPQAGDEADMAADRSDQFDRREAPSA